MKNKISGGKWNAIKKGSAAIQSEYDDFYIQNLNGTLDAIAQALDGETYYPAALHTIKKHLMMQIRNPGHPLFIMARDKSIFAIDAHRMSHDLMRVMFYRHVESMIPDKNVIRLNFIRKEGQA